MVNKVILIGNLGADPEIHVFESGNKIARIRVATTERIYNPATTTWSDHTEWHYVVVGQRQANFVEMYVKKGSQVYVEGRLRRREWGEGEERRSTTEIRVDEIRLLGRRSDNGEITQQSQPYQQQPFSQQQAPQPQNSGQSGQNYNPQPASSEPSSNDMTTDDLPF